MTDQVAATTHWGAHDQDDPFPLMARLREQGAVHPVTLADGHAAWLVVAYEEARATLSDPRLSKDMQAALARDAGIVAEGLPGPALARHMLNVDGPDHTRLRRLVSGAFSPSRVQSMQPRIAAIVDALLDGIAARDPDRPVDLVASFAFPMPFTVICELLGIPHGDREAFGTELRALVDAPERTRAEAAAAAVIDMLGELVARKRQTPADDLVTALIAARDGAERLSEQELRSTIFQLVVAGHDTTTNLIGNGVVALHRHPDQLAALRNHPDRIAPAVEELLRFDPPAHHATFRYAVEDLQIAGAAIPAGSQVVVCLAGANRDASRFADPDALDIARTDQRHVAFGHGIHHCLGAGLARLEARVALGSLFRRFPRMRIAIPFDELRWSHGDGLVLRGLAELPVVAGPEAGRLPRRLDPNQKENHVNTIEQLEVIVDDLQRLAAGVGPSQFGNDTPCAKFAVRDLFGHMIGGAAQFAPQLRGQPAPVAAPVDVDDGELPSTMNAALDDLLAAAKAPGAFERTVTLPFGQVTGDVLVRFLTVDGMVHASDLARSTGQDYAPSEDLAGEVLATARALIRPEMRDGDTFAAETPVADAAPNLTRLVAFTGREV